MTKSLNILNFTDIIFIHLMVSVINVYILHNVHTYVHKCANTYVIMIKYFVGIIIGKIVFVYVYVHKLAFWDIRIALSCKCACPC